VTVVATGLNRAAARQSVRGHEREPLRTPIKLVRNATTGQPEFGHDDFVQTSAPTPGFASALRGGRSESASAPAAADFGGDNSYLDIPAFLRRQAD
jgi:cell division protein FtsZ